MTPDRARICHQIDRTDISVRQIRVLLADMPRMLIDMLTDIVMAHPEMMISGKVEETMSEQSRVAFAQYFTKIRYLTHLPE